MKNTETEDKIEMSAKVRAVVAALGKRFPNLTDKMHLDSLLHYMAAELDRCNDTLIVRMFEATSAVDVPTAAVDEFRKALQCVQGRRWNLRKFRTPRAQVPALKP